MVIMTCMLMAGLASLVAGLSGGQDGKWRVSHNDGQARSIPVR